MTGNTGLSGGTMARTRLSSNANPLSYPACDTRAPSYALVTKETRPVPSLCMFTQMCYLKHFQCWSPCLMLTIPCLPDLPLHKKSAGSRQSSQEASDLTLWDGYGPLCAEPALRFRSGTHVVFIMGFDSHLLFLK